jgi:hypothetical protein
MADGPKARIVALMDIAFVALTELVWRNRFFYTAALMNFCKIIGAGVENGSSHRKTPFL